MSITLANGVTIPKVAFGTWTFDNETVIAPVVQALHSGYRLVDTAAYYGNEIGLGKALKRSGLPREDVMVTSKVWTADRGYDKTLAAFDASLERLNTDYLDLYLIHWPAVETRHADWRRQNAETWRALERLYREGRVKAIGVCNFTPKYLQALQETAEIAPMLDQIEYHPGFRQAQTVEYCQSQGIALQAWSPFGRGDIFSNPLILQLSEKYGKTPSQVCLQWILDRGLCAIAKSSTETRMRENLNVDTFTLAPEDMQAIDALQYTGKLGYDPEKMRF